MFASEARPLRTALATKFHPILQVRRVGVRSPTLSSVARSTIRFYTHDMNLDAEISRLEKVRAYRSMMRKSVKTVRDWFLWASMLLVPAIGHACSCISEGPVSSIKLGTSVIFRGTVAEVTFIPDADTGGRYQVRFAVKEMFSGDPKPEEVVYTSPGGSMCGFDFEQGSEYVVFTDQSTKDKTLRTSICSRTSKLSPGVDNESVTWMREHKEHNP
jgi:hypothetical protein